MATWTEEGLLLDYPGNTIGLVDQWLGKTEIWYWTEIGTLLEEPTDTVEYVTDWHGYDIDLAIALAGAYQIIDWNEDQPQGTISGIVVYPDGSVAGGAVVRLYNRDNNRYYIRETITNESGNYEFENVPGGISGDYYLIALDPDGGGTYPLATKDRQPHNGTVGLSFSGALYDMRGWDGAQWVYWTTADPSAAPSETTPPAGGPVVNKQITGVRQSS